jgi:hypothetical protein
MLVLTTGRLSPYFALRIGENGLATDTFHLFNIQPKIEARYEVIFFESLPRTDMRAYNIVLTGEAQHVQKRQEG